MLRYLFITIIIRKFSISSTMFLALLFGYLFHSVRLGDAYGYSPDNPTQPYYPPSPEFGYGQFAQKLCGFPNVMPAMKNVRPEKLHGHWYTYRQTTPSGIQTINSHIMIRGIAKIVMPLTEIVAEYQSLTAAEYHALDGNCHYDIWVGVVGTNGYQLGDDHFSDLGYSPTPGNSVMVQTDYRRFSIIYGCAQPNLATGLCQQPFVFVNTRIRPSKMSQNDKHDIDRATNAAFGPYCISANDLPLQSFVDARPDCDFPDPPGCAEKKINSLSGLPEPLLY